MTAGRVEVHSDFPGVAAGARMTVEPGYAKRLPCGRLIVAYLSVDVSGEEHELAILIQGQREHLRWLSGFHSLGSTFCVGPHHNVSHLETHYDAQGRVQAVVLDVI